jgi:hypothetical protein
MAIEEINGSRRRDFILSPESKNSWRWCRFVETLKNLLSPLTSVKHALPAVVIPSSELHLVTVNSYYAQWSPDKVFWPLQTKQVSK